MNDFDNINEYNDPDDSLGPCLDFSSGNTAIEDNTDMLMEYNQTGILEDMFGILGF